MSEPASLAGGVSSSEFSRASGPRPAAPRPHRRRLGLFKAIRAINANAITFFDEAAYRKAFVEYRALGGLILVNDPDALHEILVTRAADYIKSNQYRRLLTPSLGDGLLTAEGETWQTTRRTVAPLFSPRAYARFIADINVCTDAMIQRWRERAGVDAPLDLSAEMQRLTYEVISRSVFSGALDDDRARIHNAMALYFDTVCRIDLATVFNLPVWVPTLNRLRARPALSVYRSVVDGLVAKRLGDRDRKTPDLLDRLMRIGDPKTGATLSEGMVCDNIRTFLVAGHDTTANALAWVSYLLALHPDAETRVLEEIEHELGDRPPEVESLDRLAFTRAVVKEALRLYPPVPLIGRQSLRPVTLGGRLRKKGQAIVISPWVVHRHCALWQDPDQFLPERFLPPADSGILDGAYVPFGLGPRSCIGMGFAMQEILAVVATVLPRFHFRLVDAATVLPEARATLRPAGGLKVFATPRPESRRLGG